MVQKSKNVSLVFRMHQPVGLARFNHFRRQGRGFDQYFEVPAPGESYYLRQHAARTYYPFNELLRSLLTGYEDFGFTLSVSGVMLEQLERTDPELLSSISQLAADRRVELTAQTYHNSYSWFYSHREYAQQLREHRAALRTYLRAKPRLLSVSSIMLTPELASFVSALGYKGVIVESSTGSSFAVKPDHLAPDLSDLAVEYRFAKRLPDTLAVLPARSLDARLDRLTAEQLADEIAASADDHAVLQLDYESLSETHTENWINLMEQLPQAFEKRNISFRSPSRLIRQSLQQNTISRPKQKFLENRLQQEAIEQLYSIEKLIASLEQTYRDRVTSRQIAGTWRKLQTADHFAWMATSGFMAGDSGNSPYDSPYDAYINYMNVLQDFTAEVEKLAK
ncbi:MAG: Glycosyl hydrolase family 57 [candidate division WS6 bacterium OLB20]|uniref:Glycosyl hydrolase family 57 n=1 Tax=candidate division WS6 bacterium OLB20 TaxID=1617426 RepID=A0A136LZZ3_9BACT|nr:MAG: Glycosyl hydrolase family 57 [candidate division WS6 bacterium OLB20]